MKMAREEKGGQKDYKNNYRKQQNGTSKSFPRIITLNVSGLISNQKTVAELI